MRKTGGESLALPVGGGITPMELSAVMQTIHTANHAVRHGISRSKIRTLVPFILTASMILAGCKNIDVNQIANMQGSFTSVDQAGPRTGQTYSDDITYETIYNQAIALAQQEGFDERDAVQEVRLKAPYTKAEVRVLNGDVNATITQTNQGVIGPQSGLHLNVQGNGDGNWTVEISAQDCLSVDKVCSQPVKTTVSGNFDNTAPSVSLSTTSAPNNQGILISGNASDGPEGVGVSSVDVLSCGSNTTVPVQLNPDGSFSAIVGPVIGDNCYYALARDLIGHSTTGTENGSRSTFTYQISVDEQIIQMPDGSYKAIANGSTNLYPPASISLQRCDNLGCEDLNLASQTQNRLESNPFFPRSPGTTKLVATATDQWGNSNLTDSATFNYDFSVTAAAQVDQSGKITVTAQALNSNTPDVRIDIRTCEGGEQPQVLNRNSDASQSIGGITPKIGQNDLCLSATDGHGAVAVGRAQAAYGLSEVGLGLQPNIAPSEIPDKAQPFFLANPPDNINAGSIVVYLGQKNWQNWNQPQDFACTNVGPVVINGQKWKVGIKCPDVQNVGDVTYRVDFEDVNGYRFSAFYPVNSNTIDLPDKPNFGQLIRFFAPHISGTALSMMVGGLWYEQGKRKVKRNLAGELGNLISRNRGKSKIEQLRKTHKASRLYHLNEREITVFDTVHNIWNDAVAGKLASSMRRLQDMDFRATPELYKINLAVLSGMINLAEQRVATLLRNRNIFPVQSPEITELFSAIRDMARMHDEWNGKAEKARVKRGLEPIWGLIDADRRANLLRSVSTLQVLEDAYSHAKSQRREFIHNYRGIFLRNENAIVQFKEIVRLLCDWGNFQMARALIDEAKRRTHPSTQELDVYYTNGLNREKRSYFQGLTSTLVDDLKRTEGKQKHFREFAQGKRLPPEFEDEMVTVGQIFYDSLTLNFYGVLQNSERLFTMYGETEFSLIEPLLIAAIEGLYNDFRTVVNSHDSNTISKAVMNPLGRLQALNVTADWLKKVKIPHRKELFDMMDEIMIVYTARTAPFESFEKVIGPVYMQNAAQLSILVNRLVSWGDYATAQACIDAFPLVKEKAPVQAELNLHYSVGIKAQVINVARNEGMSIEQLRRKYRVPAEQQHVFEDLLHIEQEIKLGHVKSALVLCDRLNTQGTYSKEILDDSARYALTHAYNALRKAHEEKNRTVFEKDELYVLASYIKATGNKPWVVGLGFKDAQNLIAYADEITIVGMAIKERTSFMQLIQRSSIQLPQQISALTHILSTWGDFDLAYRAIDQFVLPGEKERHFAQFDRTYLSPIRTRYMDLIRAQNRTGIATLLKAAQYPPVLLNEFQAINVLELAVQKDDVTQSFLASKQLMQLNPGQHGFVAEMLDGVLGKMAHELEGIIQTHDRKLVGSRQFSDYRKAVQVVEKEQWFLQTIPVDNKKRVAEALSEIELVSMAANRQRDAYIYYLEVNETDAERYAQKLAQWGQYEALEIIAHSSKKDRVITAAQRTYESGIIAIQNVVIEAFISGNSPEQAIAQAKQTYALPLSVQTAMEKYRNSDREIKSAIADAEALYIAAQMKMEEDPQTAIGNIKRGSSKEVLYEAYKLSPEKARAFILAVIALYKAPKTLAMGTDKFVWTKKGVEIGQVQKQTRKIFKRLHPDTATETARTMPTLAERNAFILFADLAYHRFNELYDKEKDMTPLNMRFDKLFLKREVAFVLSDALVKLAVPGYTPSVENGLLLALTDTVESALRK